MKRSAPTLSHILACFIKVASVVIAASYLAVGQAQLPEVHLDAKGLAPRSIEDLTGSRIARVYASAWRDVSRSLESDQSDGVNEEFVGFAKDRIERRIEGQKQTGVHVRIIDHGHNLKAVFYSSDGTALQLIDHAQLEIQMFDGDRLLDTETAPHDYIVLLTPGADRWYVRDLEEVPPAKSN